jgi:hypothetical protein
MQIPENPSVPSRVWLCGIDCFNRFWARSLYFSHLSGFVFLGSLKDGVIGELAARRSPNVNQVGSEMIQCAPHVLDGIPNDGRPFSGEGLVEFDIEGAIAGIRIVLMREGVGVGSVEGFERICEVEDVFIGPF